MGQPIATSPRIMFFYYGWYHPLNHGIANYGSSTMFQLWFIYTYIYIYGVCIY